MSVKAAVSLEDYLQTSYEWEPEWVDGELLERPMPTFDHAYTIGLIVQAVGSSRPRTGLMAAPGVRLPMGGRVRIPDVSIFAGERPSTRYPVNAPLAVVEVLSPEDSASEMTSKFDEYAAWGVAYIWEVDPDHRRAYRYDNGSFLRVENLEIPELGFSIAVSALFA